MHLPLLHISDRTEPLEWDEDPLRLGRREGRDIIPWLADPQSIIERSRKRNAFLDGASLGFAALGSEIMYFSLLGGVFSSYDRDYALSIAGVIIPSTVINQFVKGRFKYSRPPREAMHRLAFVAPGDFTFPSGHAQNAVALGVYLAMMAKRQWVRVVGISFAILVPWSRWQLGVHYPRDVLAGALIGATTAAAVAVVEPEFREWWASEPRGARSFAVLYTCSIVGMLSGNPLAAFPLGLAGGLAVGSDASGRFRLNLDQPVSKKKRTARGLLGTAILLGTGFATRPLLKRESTAAAALAGTMVGLSLTWAVPVVTTFAERIDLARKKWWKRRNVKRKRFKK